MLASDGREVHATAWVFGCVIPSAPPPNHVLGLDAMEQILNVNPYVSTGVGPRGHLRPTAKSNAVSPRLNKQQLANGSEILERNRRLSDRRVLTINKTYTHTHFDLLDLLSTLVAYIAVVWS